MSQVYITESGDMVDDIAFKIFADEGMIAQILLLNPGLIEQPEILPYGLEIILPEVPVVLVTNEIEDIWS